MLKNVKKNNVSILQGDVEMQLAKKSSTQAMLKTAISSVLCLLLNATHAASLNITNDPLFIADSVAPGIFVMMDDSGSMDWSILTSPYYDYEDYYEDSSSLNTSGLFRAYTEGGQCSSGWRYFYYMYDNDDDLYNVCKISENLAAYKRDWRIKSAEFNVMFYDPSETYKPWIAKDDVSSNNSARLFPDASFSSVRSNPQPGETGYDDFTDLSGFIWEVADSDSFGYCGSRPDGPENDNDYNRCATDSDCGGAVCNKSKVDLWDSHKRYTVNNNSIKVEAITYLFNDTSRQCPYDNEPDEDRINACFGRQVTRLADITNAAEVAGIKQNIANWYQYNRKRSLLAKSAVASVVDSAPFYRFGMGTLHDEFFTPLPADNVTDYIPHNQNLFNKFAQWNWQRQGTPLRDGLKKAGTYFQGKRYGYTGNDKPIVHAGCRPSCDNGHPRPNYFFLKCNYIFR
ncbi:MAG: hypothetical protein KZQ67_17565 [gamma proteobacterium symbiont of Bathyaustriella thionipta]|nr:hypothetical protein [gamma proteobacterium symbiont of Bathyaustriella thionipta]